MMKTTVRVISISVLMISFIIAVTHFLLSTTELEAAELESAIGANSYVALSELGGSHQTFGTAIKFTHGRGNRSGQTSKRTTTLSDQEQPTECDAATGRLDHAVIETRTLKGAYLIIIARLGKGEVSRRLNHYRLAVVEEYVLRRGTDLKYVLAEGSKVKGLGRVELYVGGRLLYVMPLKKNASGYCLPGREGY